MKERRRRPRSTREQKATGIVQAIIRDPEDAAKLLERDVEAGGDVDVLLGLLDAAKAIFYLRGVTLDETLAELRQRIKNKAGRK